MPAFNRENKVRWEDLAPSLQKTINDIWGDEPELSRYKADPYKWDIKALWKVIDTIINALGGGPGGGPGGYDVTKITNIFTTINQTINLTETSIGQYEYWPNANIHTATSSTEGGLLWVPNLGSGAYCRRCTCFYNLYPINIMPTYSLGGVTYSNVKRDVIASDYIYIEFIAPSNHFYISVPLGVQCCPFLDSANNIIAWDPSVNLSCGAYTSKGAFTRLYAWIPFSTSLSGATASSQVVSNGNLNGNVISIYEVHMNGGGGNAVVITCPNKYYIDISNHTAGTVHPSSFFKSNIIGRAGAYATPPVWIPDDKWVSYIHTDTNVNNLISRVKSFS